MWFCRSIINTPTIPGKVIIHYSQHDSQMGKEDHSESQGEGKKSISLINLARLATLARLI